MLNSADMMHLQLLVKDTWLQHLPVFLCVTVSRHCHVYLTQLFKKAVLCSPCHLSLAVCSV